MAESKHRNDVTKRAFKMKAITVRGIPDKTYNTLTELAAKNGRSLQQQVRMILERESFLHKLGLLKRAKKWREELQDRNWGFISEDIRAERDRL